MTRPSKGLLVLSAFLFPLVAKPQATCKLYVATTNQGMPVTTSPLPPVPSEPKTIVTPNSSLSSSSPDATHKTANFSSADSKTQVASPKGEAVPAPNSSIDKIQSKGTITEEIPPIAPAIEPVVQIAHLDASLPTPSKQSSGSGVDILTDIQPSHVNDHKQKPVSTVNENNEFATRTVDIRTLESSVTPSTKLKSDTNTNSSSAEIESVLPVQNETISEKPAKTIVESDKTEAVSTEKHINSNAISSTHDFIDSGASGLLAAVNQSTLKGNSGSIAGSKAKDQSSFSCDATFYQKWSTLNITCGGLALDIEAAVKQSSCVIHSGSFTTASGHTCFSMCNFPACTNDKWDYTAVNGLSSAIYAKVPLSSFIWSDIATTAKSLAAGSTPLKLDSPFVSSKQCPFSSEDSFASCSCLQADPVVPPIVAAEKRAEIKRTINSGIVPLDKTSKAAVVIAPVTKGIASVTVTVSSVTAITTNVLSAVSSTTSSVSAASGSVAITTMEVCQFGVMINQLHLEGKSSVLSHLGIQMSTSTFNFLPFGKLDHRSTSDRHRRLETESSSADSGIAIYSRFLGIREDMLFLVTLAGVICVLAGVLVLFVVVCLISGLFMSRQVFIDKFFDKMIGFEILVLLLSQYTIGVTATYQIYRSAERNELTDPKMFVALASLIFIAIGIIFYGYIIVRRNEDEIKDVGTSTHLKKAVCMRYGPLYDEYKYKDRFFFAPKMMLALASGCITGYVGISSRLQVIFLLSAHVIFFFYLETRSPHHSKFLQTTTSFVAVMKIAVLVLTFFLISAATVDGLPTELQNGISVAIVGLNLLVIFLLMVRSLYALYKKYKMQKEATDHVADETKGQEYYNDSTPLPPVRMYEHEAGPYHTQDNGMKKRPEHADSSHVVSRKHQLAVEL